MFHFLRPVVSAPRRFCAPSFLRPVVSAPRRFCAPSFLRPVVSAFSLMACLLTLPAQAGFYSGPVYSGGQLVQTLANGQGFPPYPLPYGPVSGGGYGQNGGVPGSAVCSKEIDTTFTWVPASGQTMTSDPPPATIIVTESCTASASGMNGSGVYGSASCDNGLNGPVVNGPGTSSCTSTRYKTMSGGATVSLTCTPSASGIGSNGTSAYVSYAAAIYPVFVNPGGAIKDSSGNYNILVGQSCSASLSGIPAALLNNTANPPTYQWSVSGTTFQSWTVSADQSTTTEVDGPGVLTNSTASWFWNDNLGSGNSTSETVTCTATVTPPAGQGAAFSVSVSQPVTVWVPIWSETGTGDGMYVVNRTPTSSPDFWVEAGPTPGGNDEGGMNWMGSVHSPLPATFSDGTLIMAQLVIPGNSIVAQGMHYHVSNNGQEGLDTSYPYPNENTGNLFASHDSPGIDLTNTVAGCAAYSAVTQDQFEDYALFTPPGSSQCVPLGHFVWTTDGNVTEPYRSNIYDWAYFGSGSAGSMNPSGTRPFVQLNSFPSWTQNSGNNSYYWVGG